MRPIQMTEIGIPRAGVVSGARGVGAGERDTLTGEGRTYARLHPLDNFERRPLVVRLISVQGTGMREELDSGQLQLPVLEKFSTYAHKMRPPRLPAPPVAAATSTACSYRWAPVIVSSASLVVEILPADHVLRSSKFTEDTQCVNCAIRVFSIMPIKEDFIASDGVAGTLHTLPAFLE